MMMMMMLRLVGVVGVALLLCIPSCCLSFSSTTRATRQQQQQQQRPAFLLSSRTTSLLATVGTTTTAAAVNDTSSTSSEPPPPTTIDFETYCRDHFDMFEIYPLTLSNHKPLGCTVEESLAKCGKGLVHHVFVCKVVDGGRAQEAGIQVGDVILGVTDTFGTCVSLVADCGLQQIQSLVAACPKHLPLELVIGRGTNVLEQHETALVDLCTLGGEADKQVEECINAMHGDLEYMLDEERYYGKETKDGTQIIANDDNSIQEQEEEESNELLDSMFDMWAEEFPAATTTDQPEKSEQGTKKKKPAAAPWSSRSSPSGTFVRDPTTGEMKNIDA